MLNESPNTARDYLLNLTMMVTTDKISLYWQPYFTPEFTKMIDISRFVPIN